MTKPELRKHYKERRKALSLDEIESQSLEIANNSLALPIWNKTTYSLFLSITRQKEVNTEFLLHILQGKDKNIALSKSNFSTYEMKHMLLTDSTKIKINSFGIPEPEDGFEIYPSQIDVVFIPLLAFDTNGNRIGYGKGFYDRFLEQCKENTVKIGLSFFDAESNLIPIEATDIAMDYCVTPQKNYRFSAPDSRPSSLKIH